jgi:hypothetical protein
MRRAFYESFIGAMGALLFVAAGPAMGQSANDADFKPIFDGKTLEGWEGDPKYWSVEDGAIVGKVTPETILKQNTFLIWRGGETRDFELKMEYRISSGANSGINYRSTEVEGVPFGLRGYQADIDAANRYTGQNYEERGRAFLSLRGDISSIGAEGKPSIIGSLGKNDELAALLKADDWNAVHLIVRGNVMIHMINGRVMSVTVDDDAEGRRFDGLLGIQVHVGPPMKVEYRNIKIKHVDAAK